MRGSVRDPYRGYSDLALPLGALMSPPWSCPECARQFTRRNQRHACGTGDRESVLHNRPREVVDLYRTLEAFVESLGPVEFVARERYVLLRTARIFADLVLMSDALRVAIHLPRRVDHDLFIKVGSDRRQVTHVAKLRNPEELEMLKPYLREAYRYSTAGVRPSDRK